jgi:hypothetical protein
VAPTGLVEISMASLRSYVPWFNCNRPVLACLILCDFGIKRVLQVKQIRGVNPLSISLANLVATVL